MEELLRWFPEGSYQLLIHADKQMLTGSADGQLYQQVVDELLSDLGMIEIPSLKGRYTTSTIAMVKTIYLKEIQPEKKKKEKKTGIVLDFGDEMYVYQYDALDDLIREALKKGEIARTNVRLFKRPVYSYRSKEGGREHFLYATPAGKLLVAQDRLSVRAMAGAGMGRSLGMLDERDFAELNNVLPSSPVWYLVTDQHNKKKSLDLAHEQGATEQDLANLQRRVDQAAKFIVGWLDMDDELVLHERVIFESSGIAEELFKNSGYEWSMSPFPEESELKSETTLEGSVIVVTTSFSLEEIRKWVKENAAEEE